MIRIVRKCPSPVFEDALIFRMDEDPSFELKKWPLFAISPCPIDRLRKTYQNKNEPSRKMRRVLRPLTPHKIYYGGF